MRDLEGRIILVTGAAGGIGKEICKRFAEEGSIVIATDLNALGLEDLTAWKDKENSVSSPYRFVSLLKNTLVCRRALSAWGCLELNSRKSRI